MSATSTATTSGETTQESLNAAARGTRESPSYPRYPSEKRPTNMADESTMSQHTQMQTSVTHSAAPYTVRRVSGPGSTPPSPHMTYGEHRYGEQRVLGERYVEKEVRVPKVVVTEETIEKVVIVPETVRKEEIVEETQTVRERIVEVETPIYQSTYVEVPEVQYVEKVVEVPRTIFQEKIREVPRVEVQEHITYKPKIIVVEKVEEVPEVEIVEVPVDKIVEIPEVREQIVVKEVKVDRYVECPVAEYVDVEVPVDVHRKLPVPVQSITTLNFNVPKMATRVEKVPIPVYAPRFREVPVPVEQMDEETLLSSQELLMEIAAVADQPYPSLCDLETVGARTKSFRPNLHTDTNRVLQSWRAQISESIHTGQPAVTSCVPGGDIRNGDRSFSTKFGRSYSRTSTSGPRYTSGHPTEVIDQSTDAF